ncbi:hypothetical protein LJC58_01760 [Lachnospiraceae bacterium OttesenSCG-928-D06]|nr:hypothetical protein [Lachnospiraceae bacterium OttesenSCG-928-D06]
MKKYFLAVILLMLICAIPVQAANNWNQENGSWYYYENDMRKTGWLNEAGKTYYLAADGRMLTGWQLIENQWYLFRGDGSAIKADWWYENGTWYYLALDGTMLTNSYGPDGCWMGADGKWNPDNKSDVMKYADDNAKKYILNWNTDSDVKGVGAGTNDMAIVYVLLGKETESALDAKELEVYKAAKAFIDQEIDRDQDSDYQKAVKIAKYIWRTAEYSERGTGTYGTLIEGKAVCNGYARTFKMLANAVGLECYIVGSADHAWNIVRIDGEWYNADTTESKSGYTDKNIPMLLRCDDEYVLHKFKYGDSPNCTATKYTESNMK